MNLYDIFFDGILKPIRYKHLEIITKHECKTIIDLGCGTGAQCHILSKHGYTVVGIDATKKMIQIAKNKKIDNTTFLCANITENQYENNSFDCAILTMVLHPNNQEEITKIINEAKRIVTKQGIIIITDYDFGTPIKGKPVEGIIYIIESFAKPSHRNNYYEFMNQGGLEKIIKKQEHKIAESYLFYNGSIKTCVIKP